MTIYEVGVNVDYEGDFNVKYFKYKSAADKYEKWLNNNPDESNSGYGRTYITFEEVNEER